MLHVYFSAKTYYSGFIKANLSLQMMTMVAEASACAKDINQVQNQEVAKSQFVLIPILLIIIIVKSLFHDISIVIVAVTISLVQMNLANLRTRSLTQTWTITQSSLASKCFLNSIQHKRLVWQRHTPKCREGVTLPN